MQSISIHPRIRTGIKLVAGIFCIILVLSGCSTTTPAIKDDTSTANSETRPRQPSSADPQLQKRFDAAVALMRQDKVDKAKLNLQALIDQNPRLPGPYINLGIIQLNEGDPVKAAASFATALELKPGSLPARNQLGVALRMQGKFQEAEKTYRTALEIEPDYLLAHRNLGILYDLYLSKPEQALEHYKRCQALGDSNEKEIAGWILDLERRINSSK
ncbi:MAG: tetratricopeptide repeat protein [Candidatus Thiodiazotropha sp. (ex. Lucinisca nassula)]|nr:tetratricopeptide repeat protein [Candidatus Thiodiazotropha sp. (ex. Lucinisca nassula)]